MNLSEQQEIKKQITSVLNELSNYERLLCTDNLNTDEKFIIEYAEMPKLYNLLGQLYFKSVRGMTI